MPLTTSKKNIYLSKKVGKNITRIDLLTPWLQRRPWPRLNAQSVARNLTVLAEQENATTGKSRADSCD